MEYYGIRTNDGLYHHGIKGMHWGIRRFQNQDGSLTSAGQSRYDRQISKLNARGDKYLEKSKAAKSNFRAVNNARKAGNAYARADYKQRVHNAQGFKAKVSEMFGHRGQQHALQSAEKTYKLMANASKKDNSTIRYDSGAFNSRQIANYHKNIANAHTAGQKFVNTYATLPGMTLKTTSGRTTTLGKEFVVSALTMGYGSLASDALYKRSASGKKQREEILKKYNKR